MAKKVRWIQIHEELCDKSEATGSSVATLACKRIAELEALVTELVDDLEAEVRSNYVHDGDVHSVDLHRLERDMELVNRARRALGGES